MANYSWFEIELDYEKFWKLKSLINFVMEFYIFRTFSHRRIFRFKPFNSHNSFWINSATVENAPTELILLFSEYTARTELQTNSLLRCSIKRWIFRGYLTKNNKSVFVHFCLIGTCRCVKSFVNDWSKLFRFKKICDFYLSYI